MNLQPVERVSVADAVFGQLRGEILAGRLAPADAMPRERALTELTGVNRQAVREALKRLDQAGLVETRHGGPTRVRDSLRHAGLDLLPALLTRPDGTVDLVVARSVMEMRPRSAPTRPASAPSGRWPLADQLLAVVDAMAAVVDDTAPRRPSTGASGSSW
jgi:DNA-binding transcriptional regulator YhcF (GntR family)